MKSTWLFCLLALPFALSMASGCSFKGGADDAIQQQADAEFTKQKSELNPLVGTWTGNLVTDDHGVVPIFLNVYAVTSSDNRDPSGRRIQRADPGATLFSTTVARYSSTFNGSYSVSDGRLELNSVQSTAPANGNNDPTSGAANQDLLSSLHLVYNASNRSLSGDVFAVGGHLGYVTLQFNPNQSATSGGTFQNQQAEILRNEYKLITGNSGAGIYTAHIPANVSGPKAFDLYLKMFVEDLSPTNPVLRASYTLDCSFDFSGSLRRTLGGTLNMEYNPPRISLSSRGIDQPFAGNYVVEFTNGSFGQNSDGSINYNKITTTYVSPNQGISLSNLVLHRIAKLPPACPDIPDLKQPGDICTGASCGSAKPKPRHKPRPPAHRRRPHATGIEELSVDPTE